MDDRMILAEEFFGEVEIGHDDFCLQDLMEPSSPKRRAAAPEHLLKMAKSGDAEAQFELGQHYYDQGNDASARKWLIRATTQGHQEAKELLAQLNAEAEQGKVM